MRALQFWRHWYEMLTGQTGTNCMEDFGALEVSSICDDTPARLKSPLRQRCQNITAHGLESGACSPANVLRHSTTMPQL